MNTSTLIRTLAAAAALAVAVASPAHADSYSYVQPDDNTAIMQEVADALADVEIRMDTAPLEARTGWIGPKSTFAMARGNAIVINKEWTTGTYEDMAAALNFDISMGFHNGGCSPIRTVALHESAHVLNNRRGGIPEMRVLLAAGTGPRPDLKGSLSGYSFDADGSVDPGEALAEAFVAVMCGTAGVDERKIYGMLVN